MTSYIGPLLAACLGAFACAAQATEPAGSTRAVDTSISSARVEKGPWDVMPVDTSRLGSLRGGAALSANVAQNGTVQGNTTTNVSAGANSVSGGSFANASGLPTVIQNSGANVVIQNSTVINVVFRP